MRRGLRPFQNISFIASWQFCEKVGPDEKGIETQLPEDAKDYGENCVRK